MPKKKEKLRYIFLSVLVAYEELMKSSGSTPSTSNKILFLKSEATNSLLEYTGSKILT